MTHDIRTPMNAVIGFTSLAQQHINEREQVADYLKKISASSQHLLSIINDILDMSRIESGKVSLETKPVHLPDLVDNIHNIIQVGTAQKHISFTVDTVGMENADVIADPLRLNQILINILSNSVKFTHWAARSPCGFCKGIPRRPALQIMNFAFRIAASA